MKKKILLSFFLLAVSFSVFAGDVATFEDMGFSQDGSVYVFGQYGTTDKTFLPYAEIYTVDVAKNDFVKNGVFTSKGVTGKSAQQVFSQVTQRAQDFLKPYNLTPVSSSSLLYLKQSEGVDDEEIVFKDFESVDEPVFYHVKVESLYRGKGANTDSSFYIKVEKKTEDGSVLSRFVAGNPEIKRKGVTNYSINRIFTTPDGKGVVFVGEKTVEDSTGVSVRYMVETAVVDK